MTTPPAPYHDFTYDKTFNKFNKNRVHVEMGDFEYVKILKQKYCIASTAYSTVSNYDLGNLYSHKHNLIPIHSVRFYRFLYMEEVR